MSNPITNTKNPTSPTNTKGSTKITVHLSAAIIAIIGIAQIITGSIINIAQGAIAITAIVIIWTIWTRTGRIEPS